MRNRKRTEHNGQVFDRLRKESPEVFHKVKAVEANFDASDLNISEENKSILWSEVDVCISNSIFFFIFIFFFFFFQ